MSAWRSTDMGARVPPPVAPHARVKSFKPQDELLKKLRGSNTPKEEGSGIIN
jgi:hypothetical protein